MRLRFSSSKGYGAKLEKYEIFTLPFEPPRGGSVVSNYLVDYEIQANSGIRYRSNFMVYVYVKDGRFFYIVKEPYLDQELRVALSNTISSLITWLAPSPIVHLDPIGYLFAEMKRNGIFGSDFSEEEIKSATYYLIRDILGYWIIDPLLRDPEIEDISCEGLSRPIKVWHRRFNSQGWLETNISFESQELLDSMVSRLVHRSGRSISTVSPIVDSVLPEGYRLAATWGKEVTSLGSSFTIRKQRTIPFTITELIRVGTISTSIAAYLWLLLELKGFVVIAGVTASGKTTLLNSLATVLNPSWKIVSIEDTREINLPHSGWKPFHTRNLTDDKKISLFDLVKLSLRERPDFVILGETRGEEVQALFQSAASGSGCITTFHASNIDSMMLRLTQPPLSVANSTLNLIDAIVFMVRSHNSSRRYVSEVFELLDSPTKIFGYRDGIWEGNAETSHRLSLRATSFNLGGKKIVTELDRRESFLDDLVGRGVIGYSDIARELGRFYASSTVVG